MNILITGASGLIGTALLNRLNDQDCRNNIYCLSRSPRSSCGNINWIQHDQAWGPFSPPDLPKIDVIYHLSGQTSSHFAKHNPIADLHANVTRFLDILEYFRTQDPLPFVVYAGTATQVGLTDTLPINESMRDKPVSFYDISKLTAETYLFEYIRNNMIRGCSLRFSNVYGRHQCGQRTDRGILDKIFLQTLSGTSLTIYGDGSFLRDYIFIDDVVSALIQSADNCERTNGHKYVVGSGQGITLKNAFLKVKAIAEKIAGFEVSVKYSSNCDPFSVIEHRNAIIDYTSFNKATGWRPKYDFDSGILAAYSSQSTIHS